MVIEYARNVLKMKKANQNKNNVFFFQKRFDSEEFDKDTPNKVVVYTNLIIYSFYLPFC